MSRFWSELVKKIEPYVPGEQPRDKKYIKLNTNENPYPPSPQVIEAMKLAADDSLRLYPDPECVELRETIAAHFGLQKEQVFVGNGSDEILAFAFMAFFNPGSPILFPDITYSFYPVYSDLFGIDYCLVPLDDEYSIPVHLFGGEHGGIVFPNPNAPTGKALALPQIREILKNNPERVVIVDEAYIDFGGESAMGIINEYPNLVVVQTLSKSRSLAGLRVGYAAGQQELMEGLNRIKNSVNSYTLDRVALAGAIAAIRDEVYFLETRSKIIGTREWVANELQKLDFNVLDSKANFIFAGHSKLPAEKLFIALRGKGILVRYFKKPRIDNFLRISIGTREEMERFILAVKEILKDS